MEPADKQKRIGTISIVAALVVVAVFWAVVIPRIGHYWAMRQETSNPELEKVLRSINPPAETRLVEIETVKENGIPVVVATYSTSSDCDGVRAHYKQEFLKHGFTYEDENQDAGPGTTGMNFSSPDYYSSMVCNIGSKPPTSYVVSLDRIPVSR